MRWGCHFIICGSLIFVLDRIFGCVQCCIVNNKVIELLKMFVLLYTCTAIAITYLGIKPAMIKVQMLLLWFFSHEFMDTRNIPLIGPLIVFPHGQFNHLPSSLPWFHCCNQLNHSTYWGPSLRTHQNYKNYDYPLSMRTYLHLGGRV